MNDQEKQPTGVPSVGEALAATKKGNLPIGSVQKILQQAPKDLKEEVIDVPEWECSVRVRSFTAAESARIKQRGFAFREGETAVAWAEMEIMQFEIGVQDPKFTEQEVRQLHLMSGRGFGRVIKWLDDNSGLDKEALQKSAEEFRGSDERAEVSASASS